MILGNKKFLDRGWVSRVGANDFKGMITLANSEWKSRRSLVAPSYSTPIIQSFTPIMLKIGRELVQEILKSADRPLVPDELIETFALRIVLETSMAGSKDKFSIDKVKQVRSAFRRFIQTQHTRILNPFFWSHKVYSFYRYLTGLDNGSEFLLNFTEKAILERLHERLEINNNNNNNQNGENKQIPFLDRMLHNLLDNPDAIKDQKTIRLFCEEILTVLLVSYESIGMTSQFILYYLACNPDIQSKVYEETCQFGIGTKELNYADFQQFTYLNQVVKETLRLHPVVASIPRITTEDLNIDNYLLPKGTLAFACVHYLHRDEQIFPEPEKFDPNRFSPDNLKNMPSDSFMPFGDGPRRCIGERIAYLEAKILIGLIVNRFDVQLVTSFKDMVIVDFITWLVKPPVLKFVPRVV